MPFLNDMMADGARRRKDADALKTDTILTDDPTTAHRARLPQNLESRFRFDVELVAKHLRQEIIGQDAALDALIDMLRVVRVDIADGRRPLYTCLLLGPTGVGKTETVRALARAIHGDADALCRVDMNTLSQEHYAASISGAPPGYVGSKEGKTILDQEKIEGTVDKPGIVLFDELEKASPEVVLSLLNVFDNGLLTTASGERTYSFRNSLIFMTSNLGADVLRREAENAGKPLHRILNALRGGGQDRRRSIAMDALLQKFPPEFVNRIDHYEVFNWIERSDVDALVLIEMEKLNRRVARHGVRVELSDALAHSIATEGFDRRFGARALRRAVRKMVEIPFAKHLLERPVDGDAVPCSYVADLVRGKTTFLNAGALPYARQMGMATVVQQDHLKTDRIGVV